MIITSDELDKLPPLTEQELNIINNAKPTPTENCPAMTAEELKEFRPCHSSRKTISINIDVAALEYFKSLSAECGVPYQTLINMYLIQCKDEKKKPVFA